MLTVTTCSKGPKIFSVLISVLDGRKSTSESGLPHSNPREHDLVEVMVPRTRNYPNELCYCVARTDHE